MPDICNIPWPLPSLSVIIVIIPNPSLPHMSVPRPGFYDVPNVSRSEQLTPLSPGPGDRGRPGDPSSPAQGPRPHTYLPPAWTEAQSHDQRDGRRDWLWLWTQVGEEVKAVALVVKGRGGLVMANRCVNL